MLDQNDLQAIAQLMAQQEQRILGSVNARFDKVEDDISSMKGDISSMQQEMSSMNTRLDRVEEDTRQTRVLVEYDVRRDIQVIAEQHSAIIERLPVTEEVDSLKGRVSTLEGVTKGHTVQIEELKKAQ